MEISDETNPILIFIETFRTWNEDQFDPDILYDVLDRQFTGGYCYHFALILKSIFHRGTICYTWPFSHVIWKDDNGMMYDFNGEYSEDVEFFIPFDWLQEHYPDFANGFIHYRIGWPTQDHNIKREIGKAWCNDQNIHYDTNLDEYFFGLHETDS